jgi:CDP-glycerol glycerophosphotransferase
MDCFERARIGYSMAEKRYITFALATAAKALKKVLPQRLKKRLKPTYTNLRRKLGFSIVDGAGNPASDAFLEALVQENVRSDIVLYESFYGRSMNCSPRAIFDALLTDPCYAHLRHIWVLNDQKGAPPALRDHPSVQFVSTKNPDYGRYLATAGTVIINSTLPTWYMRRDGQTLANTWHGVPLKKMFKYESANHPTVHRNSQRNFLQASHLLIPNAFTANALFESSDVLEAVEGRVTLTGAPRVDQTLNSDRIALRSELGVSPQQKLIFIAPTWRGNLGNVDGKMPMLDQLVDRLQELDPKEHAIFGQMHNFMGQKFAGVRSIPTGMSTNRFLAAVDVLISDYSSIMFDFLATGRQVILFVYDREEYLAERGINFPLEEIPAQLCVTVDDVMTALDQAVVSRELPQFASAKARFFPQEDGQATRRAISALFSPMSPRTKKRPRILMYCGGWKNNGITSAALNLLNTLTLYEIDVYVATEGERIEKNPELLGNLNRIAPEIHLLHRVGGTACTKEDYVTLDRYYNSNRFDDDAHRQQISTIFQREALRLFGDLSFDAVLDFSGYARYWSLLFACVAAKRRVVWQHNDLLSEAQNRFPILRGVFENYRQFDRVVSVSEETRQVNLENLSEYYLRPDCATTVRNVIRPEEIVARSLEPTSESVAVPTNRPLFVMAGRLSPEKAVARAIRALAIIRTEGHLATLFVMGTGPLESELRAVAAGAGVADSVVFAGHISNPFPIIAQSDCFVLSSDYEGQPMVLLETLTLGKPVIATDIPGCRSVLTQKNSHDLGHLVPASDEGIAQGMRDFINGNVKTSAFDAEAYREAALQDFFIQALEGFRPPLRGR